MAPPEPLLLGSGTIIVLHLNQKGFTARWLPVAGFSTSAARPQGIQQSCPYKGGYDMRVATTLTRIAAALGVAALGLGCTTSLVRAQDQAKPNIVFIMGDDIGWFNIGAYHRGMMAGRTPNLDRLAARGHALHRLLRRGELHGGAGELHHRRAADPHRADHRRPGRRPVGMPAEAPTIATALKAHGLRHRAVRQEPPRRPQRVPADGPRLRRVLRLPLPPRRDGRSRPPATTRPS